MGPQDLCPGLLVVSAVAFVAGFLIGAGLCCFVVWCDFYFFSDRGDD
jgi:hypothetical protein